MIKLIAFGGAVFMAALSVTVSSIASSGGTTDRKALGFLYNYKTEQINDLVFPGSKPLMPFGINDQGDVTGVYAYGEAGCFRSVGGSVTTVPVPDAEKCSAHGINHSDTVVGWFLAPGFMTRGFISRGSAVTALALPGCFETTADAINNAGDIVGTCTHAGELSNSAYVLDVHGTVTTFGVQGALATYPTGIDDAGEVVGYSYPLPNGFTTSFVYSHGVLRTLNISSCYDVEVTGISSAGRIVGHCINDTTYASVAFMLDSANSSVPTVLGAKAASMYPEGVNDEGQIVGIWWGQ